MRQLSALDRLFLTLEDPRAPAHLSALLFASHPGIVSNAIDEYRRRLDADPPRAG